MCLYLPRHYGGEERDEAVPDLRAAPRAELGETVLIVDDEPTVRMLVTEVLEDLGYSAIEAADGPAGLKVLQSDVRLELLITDVSLPGGMNGRQMADIARVSRPDLKVLFITGYAENAVVGNGHLEPGDGGSDQALRDGGISLPDSSIVRPHCLIETAPH
jgi:CheY-like chemotaxis protein